MFFETLGPLLARAGEVLHVDVRDRVDDDFARTQLDAIALVVSELGQAWGGLFAALEEENGVLTRGLAEALERLGAPRFEPADADMLALNADLLRRIAVASRELHEGADAEGASALRRCLREAAEIEHRLLGEARAKSPLAKVRRV